MIGETLYTYDTNRRRYTNESGEKLSSPDPAYHWCAHKVIGENKVSWYLDGNYKVDKKTLELRGIREFYGLHKTAYTAEQKADKEWRDKNHRRIIKAVESADTALLRRIDALLFN
jgi:hypothetical protein